jgi:hypothetical protein
MSECFSLWTGKISVLLCYPVWISCVTSCIRTSVPFSEMWTCASTSICYYLHGRQNLPCKSLFLKTSCKRSRKKVSHAAYDSKMMFVNFGFFLMKLQTYTLTSVYYYLHGRHKPCNSLSLKTSCKWSRKNWAMNELII